MLTGLIRRPDEAGAPAPEQVHLQFGADAAAQVALSGAASAAVARPRLRLGRTRGQPGIQVDTEERVYTDAPMGETVFTYHPKIPSLKPGTQYAYQAPHDNALPIARPF